MTESLDVVRLEPSPKSQVKEYGVLPPLVRLLNPQVLFAFVQPFSVNLKSGANGAATVKL